MSDLCGKKVLVIGLARSGQAAVRFRSIREQRSQGLIIKQKNCWVMGLSG